MKFCKLNACDKLRHIAFLLESSRLKSEKKTSVKHLKSVSEASTKRLDTNPAETLQYLSKMMLKTQGKA